MVNGWKWKYPASQSMAAGSGSMMSSQNSGRSWILVHPRGTFCSIHRRASAPSVILLSVVSTRSGIASPVSFALAARWPPEESRAPFSPIITRKPARRHRHRAPAVGRASAWLEDNQQVAARLRPDVGEVMDDVGAKGHGIAGLQDEVPARQGAA